MNQIYISPFCATGDAKPFLPSLTVLSFLPRLDSKADVALHMYILNGNDTHAYLVHFSAFYR